eukprot:5883815-Amphidinium_carterae.1
MKWQVARSKHSFTICSFWFQWYLSASGARLTTQDGDSWAIGAGLQFESHHPIAYALTFAAKAHHFEEPSFINSKDTNNDPSIQQTLDRDSAWTDDKLLSMTP